MLRRSVINFGGFKNGTWTVGSKGHKHFTLAPIRFLYRIQGNRGPGPIMMKYWWTLGQFPTGLEIPFRLQEFLHSYKLQHVPQEVEDWLACFVKNPVDEIVPAAKQLEAVLSRIPNEKRTTRPAPYKKHGVVRNAAPIKEAMDAMLAPVGLTVPASCVRAMANDADLREDLRDVVYAYRSVVEDAGSTPHRRWAAAELAGSQESSGLPIAEGDAGALHVPEFKQPTAQTIGAELASVASGKAQQPSEFGISNAAAKQIGWALDTDSATAVDETLLINTVNLAARGAASVGQFDDAALMLASSLAFSHDDDTAASIHANAACAFVQDGQFDEGRWHAKESVLLKKSPKGYAAWAVAEAYMDNTEKATEVIEEALVVHGEEAPDVLTSTARQIETLASSRMPITDTLMRGKVSQLPSQRRRGVQESYGITFGNEFDYAQFKGRLLPAKMNPGTSAPGTVFSRVGEMGMFRATSAMPEPPA